jgi:SAM-dependent methyltransferase
MTNQRIWDHYQSVGLHRFASAGPRLSYLLDRAAREGRGRPLRILNVGIGDATLERLALARGWEVDALDPSEDAVARSVAMGIRAHCGVIEAMPFADASFDAVFCSEVFEHLASDQLQAALPEIGRVLRPDGRLYGTVPFDEHLDEQRVVCPHCGEEFHRWGHQQAFTVDQMRAALSTTLAVERADVVNFVDWTALNWKGRGVAAMKKLLSLIGVHGRNENIVFVARRRAPSG